MLGQNTTSRVFSYRYVIVRLFFVLGSCTNRDDTLWILQNDTVLSISIFEVVGNSVGRLFLWLHHPEADPDFR